MPHVANFVVCTDKRKGSEKYNKETTSKNVYLLLRRRVGLFFTEIGDFFLLLLELDAETLSSPPHLCLSPLLILLLLSLLSHWKKPANKSGLISHR